MAEHSESDFKNAVGTGKDRLLNKVGWLVGEEADRRTLRNSSCCPMTW